MDRTRVLFLLIIFGALCAISVLIAVNFLNDSDGETIISRESDESISQAVPNDAILITMA